MPDLGRWSGIDQLAESCLSTSPYAYVANNPISSFDIDGRWMDDSGHITDTTGQTFGFHGSQYNPLLSFSSNDGMHTNEGAGVTDNGNNRIAQGPKPNIFKTIVNFVKKLFGRKKIKINAGPVERIPEDYSASGSRLFGLIQNANYNPMAEYRARRDNPSYNEGESSLDRSFRLMNSSHIEIMQDFGGGGYNMFGGYGRLAKAANAVAATEETGNGISKMLSSIDEFDPLVTLYRGTGGSEVGSEFLFLTDDVEYATSFIKNGGTVNQYQISRSGLYMLEKTGSLFYKNGLHGSADALEYVFEGKSLVEAVNKLAKPYP